MTTYPELAELFPDVAALGSLAAALQQIAVEHGLELGDVRANERSPISEATVEAPRPGEKHSASLLRRWNESGVPSAGGWGSA